MIKRIVFLFLVPFFCFAQIPEYYSDVDFSQTGNSLKYQISDLISDTHVINLIYTPEVWQVLKVSDLDPVNNNNILLIYGHNDTDGQSQTDRSRDKDLSCHNSSCIGLWNREHVFPRSLGTPNLGFQNAGADAHSLRPADSQMNSARSNRPFEEGSGASSYITQSGNFFPGEEWRGDVARMMMYMYVRYPAQCAATSVGVGSTSYSTFGDMPDIFLEWNVQDPVSEFEIQRNDYVSSIQGNRNPFIDNPFLATQIWNGPAAEDRWEVLNTVVVTASSMFVFPTITDNYIDIYNPNEKYLFVSIYNAAGYLLEKRPFKNQKISLGEYASGVYFIGVEHQSNRETFKVIKR
ncbi:MAG: endonuclease [Flavobacteriaceae bacterium]|nr:endonuclease [Flavobacteriaceae bacterium]